ncbi:MAG: YihY/virulence factor BrkB family protein [Janthinobacterium lividum]
MTKMAVHAWYLLRQTLSSTRRDNVLQLSAALTYYALFSLGPMLLVVVVVYGYFAGIHRVADGLFVQIQKLIGPAMATQLRGIMQYAVLDTTHPLRASLGLLTLLVAATSVFTEIQDALNRLWHVQLRPEAGWRAEVKTRLLSFGLVLVLGLMLLASLKLDIVSTHLLAKLSASFFRGSRVLVYASDLVLSLVFTTGLYALLYQVLPDARIRWRDVVVGALFTAILFLLGRFSLSYYIYHSSLRQAYGTAGTLVVLLLWVYYSALILYMGAEFTKCYAVTYGAGITAASQAQVVQTVYVTSPHGQVQVNESRRADLERELQRAADTLAAASPCPD